jgi:predicted peptidase
MRVGYRFLLYEPVPQKSPAPLLIYLHGSGERGSDLSRICRHGPPALVVKGKDFPYFVLSPQCPRRAVWDPDALDALLGHVLKTCPVDEDRVWLTGISMGGYGTWDWGTASPERFAALVPICGAGRPFLAAERLRSMPIWGFHGARDTVVPLRAHEETIKAIRSAGGTPRFTVYPTAGHDSWTTTFQNPELYTWLLRQRRRKRRSRAATRREMNRK